MGVNLETYDSFVLSWQAQSRDFEEFQIRIAYSRNEGLFFKNLYRSPQAWRHHGGLSKKKIEEVCLLHVSVVWIL